jgi:lipopolysaccharide/colanic/teichoic acid biosynthesis glycosyltransferase
MIVVVPLCIVVGLLIKLDSKGPVFHRRRVMGVKGKEFDAFKFRTMVVNGDEVLAAYPELKKKLDEEHKLKDDPRVTRMGRIIRKLSLDEFPQFFNVLRGEMSVVGPRMISPCEMQEYRKNGMNLLTVRPGITGLWQVSGRSDVTYQERVQMDMYYIRNWSVWMDINLIVKTIPALISRRGAY